jgi:hypothetical protein
MICWGVFAISPCGIQFLLQTELDLTVGVKSGLYFLLKAISLPNDYYLPFPMQMVMDEIDPVH